MSIVRQPFVLACYDTSLGAGRLSADWVTRLLQQAPTFPEAKGPVVIHNLGHGGWTSSDLLAGVSDVILKQPTHIWTELGAINDCYDAGSGPAVSLATKNANNTQMLNDFISGIPGVSITAMTMSSVSASQTGRSQLPTYYAQEMSLAQSMGLNTLDLYQNWPKPLDPTQTNGAGAFAITPTAGYGGLPDGTIWDAAHSNPNILYTADSFTAIGFGSDGVVLASNPITGPTHVEMRVINTFGNTRPMLGAANRSVNLNSYLTSDTNAVAVFSDGSIWSGAAHLADLGSSVNPGDVIGIEFDNAGRMWFMKGAARVGPIGTPVGTVYPAASVENSGQAVTARFNIDGDGLHPLWPAVSAYSFPSWVSLIRSQMAAFWPN